MNKYDDIRSTETSIDITSFEWTKIKDIAYLLTSNVHVNTKKDFIQTLKNEPRCYILKHWKPEIKLKKGIDEMVKYGQSY